MKKSTVITILMSVCLFSSANCEMRFEPVEGGQATVDSGNLFTNNNWPENSISAPTELVTVKVNNEELTFWPYLGSDFSGEGHDPISLVFFGQADPRDIRAALLALDGDRVPFGLPSTAPFDATWYDAIGDVLTTYGDDEGWRGSSIQLECGDHSTVRVHLRLFKLGDWTIGGAHFEVMIPGTSTHQVLSWELAEEFVKLDLMRSGLLDQDNPTTTTAIINPSPFRTIPAIIYNELPAELRGMIGGPLSDITDDLPLTNDGQATVFNLVATSPRLPVVNRQSFVIQFDQVIPKPFCTSGGNDYLYVSGPVHLEQISTLDADGSYKTNFTATGSLSLVPIDPETGQPNGATLIGDVLEVHMSVLNDSIDRAYSNKHQLLTPSSVDGAGQFFERIRVSSRGHNSFQLIVRCADDHATLAKKLSD